MAKKYAMNNEGLSKEYLVEVRMFDGGEKRSGYNVHDDIAQKVRDCKISFYEHYSKYGTLKGLDSKGKCKGIGVKTLSILESIIVEKFDGMKKEAPEKEPETVKNKSGTYLIGMRHSSKPYA